MSGYGETPQADPGPGPLFRRSDPETSKQAAEHISPKVAKLHAEIVRFMHLSRDWGWHAATAREIGRAMKREVWRRMGEMKEKKLVVECEPRKCTVTGRLAATWKLP